MPEGVIAEVVNGFATIDFVDSSLRGPGLARLLAIGPVETLTREGPRRRYRVAEGNASEAGLLDTVGVLARGDSGYTDALVAADQQQRDEPNRPEPRSGSKFFVGETTFDEARDTEHVKTTMSPGSGVGDMHPPPHSEVIAKVREARYATPADLGLPE